ncbi:MAG TPA: 4'-phosphopantetheinyl transferase superfamily protein [Usitatibacter sp.]|nr:4'-phosphopantetheinyl transferase superfamily protein [Usitatibacter sp.]
MSARLHVEGTEVHVWTCADARLAWLAVLSRYEDAIESRLRRTVLGKPFLAGTSLRFNRSRSHGRCVVAVSRFEIGIDLERVEPLADLAPLVEATLTARERDAFERMPQGERLAFFYRCWTRKEARLKAAGVGLRQDPRGVETNDGLSGWRWSESDPPAGYAMALAARLPFTVANQGEA